MAFHGVRFPDNISRGARGGPERRTQIVELASGDEERNASWAHSRRRFDVAYGIRRTDDLASVVAFFEARNGRLYGFRYKDWADYKSCAPSAAPAQSDQLIGTGDGMQTSFPLAKRYTSGGVDYVRAITKPVVGTVLVGANVPEGPELLTSWNNLQTGWSNTGATGANSAVTYGSFVKAYDLGVSGAGLRQHTTVAPISTGSVYRVQAWIKAGSSAQARLNVRCQPGNLDSDIRGTYAAPTIVGTAGGTVANVSSTDLGGGFWLWSFDITIGPGFTGALIGVGNITAGSTVTILGASFRQPLFTGPASGYTVDHTTGLLTFSAPPVSGTSISAGFEFDVPVRFDTDMLDVTLDIERLGSITSIPLLEIRR
jgi:uncharacterized protein (TIGR02217 family)